MLPINTFCSWNLNIVFSWGASGLFRDVSWNTAQFVLWMTYSLVNLLPILAPAFQGCTSSTWQVALSSVFFPPSCTRWVRHSHCCPASRERQAAPTAVLFIQSPTPDLSGWKPSSNHFGAQTSKIQVRLLEEFCHTVSQHWRVYEVQELSNFSRWKVTSQCLLLIVKLYLFDGSYGYLLIWLLSWDAFEEREIP